MINETIFNNVTNIQELATAEAGAGANIFFIGISILVFLFILAGASVKFDTRESFAAAALIAFFISAFMWFLALVPMALPTIFLIIFIVSIFFILLGG